MFTIIKKAISKIAQNKKQYVQVLLEGLYYVYTNFTDTKYYILLLVKNGTSLKESSELNEI